MSDAAPMSPTAAPSSDPAPSSGLAPYDGPLVPSPLVAIAGWLVPGLGYLLIGQRARAIASGATILALFVGGLLIAGVRCVDVPGYDVNGQPRRGAAAIANNRLHAVLDKPWYIPQILTGPAAIAASVASVRAAPHYDKTVGRLWDIGTLYTAVAGMLNLLVILDAAHRAGRLRDERDAADRGAT